MSWPMVVGHVWPQPLPSFHRDSTLSDKYSRGGQGHNTPIPRAHELPPNPPGVGGPFQTCHSDRFNSTVPATRERCPSKTFQFDCLPFDRVGHPAGRDTRKSCGLPWGVAQGRDERPWHRGQPTTYWHLCGRKRWWGRGDRTAEVPQLKLRERPGCDQLISRLK